MHSKCILTKHHPQFLSNITHRLTYHYDSSDKFISITINRQIYYNLQSVNIVQLIYKLSVTHC